MLEIMIDTEDAMRLVGQLEAGLTVNAILPDIEKTANRITREQIESEGARGGAPYEPLKERTVRERVRKGFGGEHPILIRIGAILNVMQQGTVSASDPTTAVVAWPESVAKFHQSKAPRTVLDRRPVLDPTQADADEIGGSWLDSYLSVARG